MKSSIRESPHEPRERRFSAHTAQINTIYLDSGQLGLTNLPGEAMFVNNHAGQHLVGRKTVQRGIGPVVEFGNGNDQNSQHVLNRKKMAQEAKEKFIFHAPVNGLDHAVGEIHVNERDLLLNKHVRPGQKLVNRARVLGTSVAHERENAIEETVPLTDLVQVLHRVAGFPFERDPEAQDGARVVVLHELDEDPQPVLEPPHGEVNVQETTHKYSNV